MELAPTWPYSFQPQQYAAPLLVTPQVWSLPAVRLANVRPLAAATGDLVLTHEPLPNCP
jgi:hypothetical protein